MYQQAFTNFRMGYASAMAWMLLLTIATTHRARLLVSPSTGFTTRRTR